MLDNFDTNAAVDADPALAMQESAPPIESSNWQASILDGVLTLRSDLKLEARVEDDQSFVVIEDPARGKFFRLGEKEYQVLCHLDGKRSGNEVAELVGSPSADPQCIEDATSLTRRVFLWLIQTNLAISDKLDNGKRLGMQSDQLQKQKTIALLNPISFKFKLFNPNQLLKRIQRLFDWLFSTWFLCLWCSLAIYSVGLVITRWSQLGDASTGILSGYSWIWLLVTWLVLKVIHELAHGIACRRYGGEVPEAGVLLLLLTPMAFVNVTSMWRFSNRWHRMTVAAAGMYVELFTSFLALIVWAHTNGVIANVAFNVFLMSSVTTILFNANPLMRFDGYFLLSDLIGVPNLYSKGTGWFRDQLKRILFGVQPVAPTFSSSEATAVKTYGVLAYFWKISISVGLILGASVLFQGAGLAMSAIGVVMWFGIPSYKQIVLMFGAAAKQPADRKRTAWSAIGVSLATALVFWGLSAPATQSAPAIVQFADEELIRASADGFIKTIFVKDGQSVSKGQPLIELDNPTLANEVFELAQQVKEAEIQARIYRDQKESGLAQAESRRAFELKTQWREKLAQAENLKLLAPADGFVFQRGIENRIGSFAKRGDPLLRHARRKQKEVVVAIDQRHLDWDSSERGKAVRVMLPGHDLIAARLKMVAPKATRTATYPSLCAPYGGALTVRQLDSSSQSSVPFELLRPHVNVVLELPESESDSYCAGQRGYAYFTTARQSLGAYLYRGVADWLEVKINQATAASY